MNPLTLLAATRRAITTRIAAALTAAYRRHNRHLTVRAHDFDRHVGEALALIEGDPLADLGYRSGTAPTEADITYQQLRSEAVLDAANEWLHDHGADLPNEWLLLEVSDVRTD